MDNIKFYEYAFTILSEAGHVTTSSPIYVNHSSGETLYIDSSKDVVTNRFERDLLSLIDNVSLLVDVRWPGVVPELDENVQIYSATVDFSERCRSQNIADIHHLLQKYWNCTHSIVFFKNKESYLISFADKDRSHILSDWFSITYEWDEIVERVGIENIAIDTCENYFLDFLYATAREYCIRPVSFEEASYGLMPLDYISKSLSSDIPLSRDEIKNMIRDNLLFFELMYGDDYVEPQYTGMEERTYYHNISDEIDRISFELELEDTDDEEQFSFEDDLDDSDNDDIFDDYDEDIDPAIFDDPTLMVKWLEQQERIEAERREQERLEAERREQERIEAERREQERLEAERREQERIEAERREQERLEAERREQERIEAERREQERLEAERREQERLEAERREQERLEAERREQERLEAERREQERIEKDRQDLFNRLEQEHLQKLKKLEEQHRSKKQSLGKQLSQLEGLQKEKEARLTKLTFLQFLEKRTIAAELMDLDKKKQELLALIQTAESDYVTMRDQERMNFNLLLVEKGL